MTRSNDAYAWQAHYNVDRSYTINGLNRIMNIGSTAFTYDGRGNLTSDGTNAFTYTSENLLKTGPSTTLAYDPLGRLYETVKSPTTTRFLYDGADLIGEYNGSNAVQRRYVHGPGVDEPIVWYEGGTVSNTTRRFLMADERGSVVSITDSAGATIHINAYDEYGIPAPGNIGRFGYTGQTWLPELGMWHYKARIYSPTLGRFMQTDPIGYSDGMNWYNYVGSDPVNWIDPTGLCSDSDQSDCDGPPIYVTGDRCGVIKCTRPGLKRSIVDQEPKGPETGKDGEGPTAAPPVLAQRSAIDWCGSEGSEKIPDGNWGLACREHDICYATPGANKERCDIQLAVDIARICSAQLAGQSLGCSAIGVIYGGGLMILGWTPGYHPARDAYNKAQPIRK